MEQRILDYKQIQLLHESERTLVYRALKEATQSSFILKLLKNPHPSINDISKFVHSYEITKQLEIPGIIKTISLEKYNHKPVLVLEDISGIALSEYLQKNTLDIKTILDIAISLADTLGNIHHHQIIHKDIKPDNIIINSETKEVRIADFGISTRLSRENPKLLKRHILEGTLNYISPEQTGRMNRGIDYRTDIYSLGVTLYEMVTAKLPFQSKDSLELIHFHITKTPTPPHQINPAIPEPISNIIMKCLSKSPEERYHSAYGLKNDLEICLQRLLDGKEIVPFEIGLNDVFDVFQIPQKLYGRAKEIDILLQSFDSICMGKSECIIISGYVGVGKTSLVNEVQKPIVKQRGYFTTGKFDQLRHDVPYSGLIEALKDLIFQALTESETDLAIMKHKLLGALRNNGQILIELIPELELIIGKQPEVSSLGSRENQNRLKMLFKSFIHIFSQKEHPLVIFLDDLQWAGLSTLILMKELITDPSIQHLLVIGSYRDHEISEASPLKLTLEEIKKEKGVIHEILLSPLTLEDVIQFMVDTVHCTKAKAAPLAQILYQKSGGNPFNLIQFLRKLHQDNYLYFDTEVKEWNWELAKIQEMQIATNIIDLLEKKIRKLPPQTQSFLGIAAAIGLRFDLRLLAFELNLPLNTILRALWKAVSEDIIIPIDQNYHLVESNELEALNEDKLASTPIFFEFVHDRLQQVAYSLMSDAEKTKTHYKLGKMLLQPQFILEQEDNIFEVVTHFNLALPLIQTKEERLRLARMNLRASRKAKNSAAYSTAYDCIHIAQSLLEPDSWKTQYGLTYEIYMELTECSYLTQRFENIDELSTVILNNAKTNLEKGDLYIIKITSYTNIAQTQKAIEEGLQCLELFGIKFSENPSKLKILGALLKVKWKLWHTPINSLEHLPEMKDPEKLFLMKVLSNLCTPAFLYNKNLMGLFVLKMMCLILDYGICDISYFVYTTYGTLLQILFRDYQQGYELGDLGIRIADKTNNNTYRSRANFVMASIINHWSKPLKTSEKYMHACYTTGMEAGEVMYVSFISVFWGFLEGSFFSNLNHALKNLRRYKSTIFSIKSKQPMHSFYTKEGLILALKDPEFCGQTIKYETFDEEEYFNILYNDPELQVAFQAYIAYRMVLCYVFQKHGEALRLWKVSFPTRKCIDSLSQEREINVYHSLTLAALYPEASSWNKFLYLWQIKKNQKILKKWVHACSQNNAHRYSLVNAEIERIQGHVTQALKYYDDSIEAAQQNQFYLEEAIASEQAGRLCTSLEKKFIAKAYIEHAYECYSRADALSKVVHLEQTYPNILKGKQLKRIDLQNNNKSMLKRTTIDTTFAEAAKSTTSESRALDLSTVLQASTVISGTIHLEVLLSQLMKIVIEAAGADRAFLIQELNGRWLIQAEKDLNKNTSYVMQSLPFEKETDLLSIIIIQYVIRTKQTVVLNDAVNIGMFTEDPYVYKYKPKSILCLPISNKGKLSAILYMENNAATDTFTPNRLDILQLLSGQIATSIENATLYSNLEAASENLRSFNTQLEDYNRNLENKVTERTTEIQSKNEQLRITLETLKEMQKQVVQQEKLAALGSLTHGVAHEIKNPLNFINNFSSLSVELIDDLYKLIPPNLEKSQYNEIKTLLDSLKINLGKIHSHSMRVDGIVVSMLKHSQETKGEKELANINQLLKEYVSLTKKSYEEKHPDISVNLESHFDPNLKLINIVPQDIGRSLMNILENAFYAVGEKFEMQGPAFQPKVKITSKQLEDKVEILIRDNGPGIPAANREKLFHPFFTTKPTGTGTGLGLSIAYDVIVQEHNGDIKVNSEEGQFTEFIIRLPSK